MKAKLAAALIVILILSSIISAVPVQEGFSAMTNRDILMMVKAKLPTEVILEKINTSDCNFDTFPSVLAELKYRGVPDDVLMAMVKSPHGGRKVSASGRNSSALIAEPAAALAPVDIAIPDGTPLEVES